MRYYLLTLIILLLLTSQTVAAPATWTEKSIHPQTGLIRVWKVGSPYSGALPDAVFAPTLQREAAELGFEIQVEVLKAADFANGFAEALRQHQEPEVIAFDNFGMLLGITTPLGRFEGILGNEGVPASLDWVQESMAELQPRGWVMLIRTARDYEAAKALALREPACASAVTGVVKGLTPDEIRVAGDTATGASRAYIDCDPTTLAGLSDEARLGNRCFLPNHDSRADVMKVCSVSGNRDLVFVSMITSFAAKRRAPQTFGRNYANWLMPADLGHKTLLAFLRRSNDGWRVLAISSDVLLSVDLSISAKIRKLSSRLDDEATDHNATVPAQLLTSDGVYPRPLTGQRFGDFSWRPSPGPDVIGQLAEFTMVSGDRELTRLFLLSEREAQLSSGWLMGGAHTGYRWRVWTIARNGTITFSEIHSFGNQTSR